MKTVRLGKTDLLVSRIGLGTAEIGFNYGIGAPTLPTEAEAIGFLNKAADLGITFFDTANYYGLAEERIGKSGILKNPRVIVETKCAQFLEKGENFTGQELEIKIRNQVTDSLKKLRVPVIDILMLHGPSQEQLEDGELIKTMRRLKQGGLVRFLGVSSRGEENALAALNAGIDVLQVAYSILDQRMAKRVLPLARRLGVGIVSRSALLKGALTLSRHQLPDKLVPLRQQVDKVEELAIASGLSLVTLAIRFVLNNSYIDTTLIGTNKVANLEKAVLALETEQLPEKILAQLENFALTDLEQIDPAKWPPLQ